MMRLHDDDTMLIILIGVGEGNGEGNGKGNGKGREGTHLRNGTLAYPYGNGGLDWTTSNQSFAYNAPQSTQQTLGSLIHARKAVPVREVGSI